MSSLKVVVPFSGGMDSTVLLYSAVEQFEEVYALTFDYGQRHHREISAAEQIIKSLNNKKITHKTIDVSFIKSLAPTSSLTNNTINTPNVKDVRGEAQPKSYVPNRNMIFLSIATAYAEANKCRVVWHGAAQADSLAGYYDGDETFVDAVNKVNILNRDNPVKIEAPLIYMSKADIVKRGVELRVPFDKTYTCYSGHEFADAETASSSLRLQGFISCGYRDPIKYKQQVKLEEIYKSKGCVDLPY